MRSSLVPVLFVAAFLSVAACSEDDAGDGTGGSGNTGNAATSNGGSGDGGSGATGGSPAGTGGASNGGASVGGTGGSGDGGAGVGGAGGAGEGGAGGASAGAFGGSCDEANDQCQDPYVCFAFMGGSLPLCTKTCTVDGDCAPESKKCNDQGYCKAN